MKMKIVLFFVLGFVSTNVFSQQIETISDYLPTNMANIKNVFFNRQIINPSLSNDTFFIKASLIVHEQWLKPPNSQMGKNISLIGHIPNTKSSIGMDLDLINTGNDIFKNQMMRFNYSYKIDINEKSNIKTGVNLGLSRYKFDPDQIYIPGLTPHPDWDYCPHLDIGLTYSRLKQNIGISYLDLINGTIKGSSSEYIITKRMIIVNYFSSYNLTRNLSFMPELIVSNDTYKNNVMIKGNVSYGDRLLAGFIFDNSIRNYGIMISCNVFKYFELGYIFEVDSSVDKQSVNSHYLKLGILIK